MKFFEFVDFVRITLKVTVEPKIFLADQLMIAHCLLTVATVLWAGLIGMLGLSAAAVIEWLLMFIIWLEFKHSE